VSYENILTKSELAESRLITGRLNVHMRVSICSSLIGLVALGVSFAASAQQTGESVIRTGRVSEDFYAAGGQVTVSADVEGDVIVAGGRVVVDRRVAGDVMAAGGFVELRANVQDDVRAAGGFVTVGGDIGGDLIAAGGTLNILPDARVSGRTWISAGQLEVEGRLDKGLRAAAGSIRIAGEVNGDVELVADRVSVLPGAKIHGDIHYTGRHEPVISAGAEVTGQVKYEPLKAGLPAHAPAAWSVAIVSVLSLMLTGVVLFLMFPGFAYGAAQAIVNDAWRCLGLGLAVLIMGPIVALLLFVTVIGIPLGVIILAAYIVFLIAGYLTSALFLGELGLRWWGKDTQASAGLRALSIAVAVLALSIIGWIPFLGTLATLAALVFGLGALKLQVIRRYSTAGRGPGRAKAVRRKKSS
jgi:cytoskeletal protein CcmA (bactofilin family)